MRAGECVGVWAGARALTCHTVRASSAAPPFPPLPAAMASLMTPFAAKASPLLPAPRRAAAVAKQMSPLSTKKRIRQDAARRVENKSKLSEARTYMKKVRASGRWRVGGSALARLGGGWARELEGQSGSESGPARAGMRCAGARPERRALPRASERAGRRRRERSRRRTCGRRARRAAMGALSADRPRSAARCARARASPPPPWLIARDGARTRGAPGRARGYFPRSKRISNPNPRFTPRPFDSFRRVSRSEGRFWNGVGWASRCGFGTGRRRVLGAAAAPAPRARALRQPPAATGARARRRARARARPPALGPERMGLALARARAARALAIAFPRALAVRARTRRRANGLAAGGGCMRTAGGGWRTAEWPVWRRALLRTRCDWCATGDKAGADPTARARADHGGLQHRRFHEGRLQG